MPRPRTDRRLQQQMLSEKPSLEDDQHVVLVRRSRGENVYEVEDAEGTLRLYSLPKRLRHVAFIRRGCFVFVKDDDTRRSSQIRGDIEAVVMPRFVKELREEPFWPARFAEPERETTHSEIIPKAGDKEEGSSEGADDWHLQGNPNRVVWSRSDLEGESSEEDDE